MAGIDASLMISPAAAAAAAGKTAAAAESGGTQSFSDVLSRMLEQYNQVDNQGDLATLSLLSGGTDDLSGAMIATEKAEIALNLTVAVRNKAMDAYKEIMNMQV